MVRFFRFDFDFLTWVLRNPNLAGAFWFHCVSRSTRILVVTFLINFLRWFWFRRLGEVSILLWNLAVWPAFIKATLLFQKKIQPIIAFVISSPRCSPAVAAWHPIMLTLQLLQTYMPWLSRKWKLQQLYALLRMSSPTLIPLCIAKYWGVECLR